MKPIKKLLKLKKEEYYKTHLSLVNPILPVKLTPKEIEVLATFMSLEGDIANDRFGTSARKIVKQELDLSDGGLGNYLKQLQNKGFVKRLSDGYTILPILFPSNQSQTYMFKLEKQ